MNIGITCYPTLGGSGIVATELGHALADRGHQVHFISYGLPFRLDTSKPNITFHEVEIYEYPLFKYPDYTLPLSVAMAKCAEQHDLDILHVHYAVPHAVAGFLAKEMLEKSDRTRPRLVTTLHGTDITLVSRDQNYGPVIKHAIEHSCGVTAVSEDLKQQTVEILGIDKAIEVIPNFYPGNAPTTDRHTMRQTLGYSDNEVVLIHSSNLREVKRIPDLLRIVAKSQHKDRLRLLILAGDTFTPYEALAEELGIRGLITVKEKVLQVEDYFQAADIGIMTSQKESFGLSLLETMAASCPAIASRVGGMPEVVNHEVTGFLYELGDLDAAAGYLDRLIADDELRQSMGRTAKARVDNVYHKDRVLDRYLAYYEQVLETCR